MISVIVSSYREDQFQTFNASLEQHIGVPFELIRMHNPGTMGIAQAYNKAAERAKFPLLCFVHEDVLFRTPNWGQLLLDIFSKQTVDVLGIAGSQIKLSLPTGWTSGIATKDFVHIEMPGEGRSTLIRNWNSKERLVPVKVLDGVFIVTKATVWSRLRFDEDNTGFHFYDIDFSLRASENHSVVVTDQILLYHASTGNFGDQWVEKSIEFHRKFKQPHLFDDNRRWKHQSRHSWYSRLITEKIRWKNKLKFCSEMGFSFRLSTIKPMVKLLMSK